MRALVLVLVVAMLATGVAVAQSTDDLLIVPGERIGPLKLGMSVTDVSKLFGTPRPATTKLVSVVIPIPDGGTAFSWEPSAESKQHGAKSQGFGVITDQGGMVYEVQSPFDTRYHTDGGLRVGSKARDVVAAFGEPSRQKIDGHEKFYIYDARGIAFLIQNDRTVWNYELVNGVWVFAPRAAP
jgi:outer membrane protein assembly factor BamE (lipoprotein component of BamABCDE complex)